MIILPAIDLMDGKCVRLKQGRSGDVTVYDDDPVRMARHWAVEGAEYLHVVDLDGAFAGRPVHRDLIGRMAEALSIPVEVGGGLRTDDDVRALLARGVDRVIIGTRACSEPEAVQRMVDEFGERIAIGIDARDEYVQVKGWTETSGIKAVALARQLDGLGVQTIIYTDTSRDGMLQGVNAKAVDEMCAAVECSVIASGGVTDAKDIQALSDLNRENLAGVIVGKALYERDLI